MLIKNSFVVPLPPDEAWRLLINVPEIVSCVPGAELVEQRGEHDYLGKMKVRLGPVAVQFAGTVVFEQIDAINRRAVAKAKGTEAKARGGASATTTFSITSSGESESKVSIETEVTLSGMVAQYGRGAGMIATLSQQIIDQFAACLSKRVQTLTRPSGAVATPDARPPNEINALSMIWRLAAAWFRSLFRRRANREDKPFRMEP
ncbi:MAG: SRPBCC family protein [Pseudolabrys sp.]|nr:SRPBCC family protein [Pseudolabrys sp.]